MKMALFAYHNSHPIIPNYVMLYLEQLKKIADKVVLSSDKELSSIEVKRLEGLGYDVFHEDHLEYDFGSWKRALKYVKGTPDVLYLVNDSCFCVGDLENLKPVKGFDFGGVYNVLMEDGTDQTFIPSYFMWFNKQCFETVKKVLENVTKQPDKVSVCQKYERGLNITLTSLGFQCYSVGGVVKGVKCYSHESLNVCNLVKKSIFTHAMMNTVILARTKKLFERIKEYFPMIDAYLATQKVSELKGIFK